MLNMGGMSRFAVPGAFAVLMSAWSGLSLAAPQPVVTVEVLGAAPDFREKMRATAESGLESLGVTVPRQLRDPGKEECETPECVSERAQRFGATHILDIQGRYANESFKLRLDVRAANGGRVLGSDAKECEICSGRDFLRAIKERTISLWTRVAREQASVVQPSGGSVVVAQTPLLPSSPPEPRPRSLWQQPLPLLGLGLMLGGAAAMGFGGYYLAVDGELDPSCHDADTCHRTPRETSRLGWGLLAGGGAAVVTGTALVLFARDSGTAPRVAVGPGRVLVSGRF